MIRPIPKLNSRTEQRVQKRLKKEPHSHVMTDSYWHIMQRINYTDEMWVKSCASFFDILNEIFTEQIRSTIFKRVFEMRVNHVKDKRWEILRILTILRRFKF